MLKGDTRNSFHVMSPIPLRDELTKKFKNINLSKASYQSGELSNNRKY